MILGFKQVTYNS